MKHLTKPQKKNKAQRGFIQAAPNGGLSNARSLPLYHSLKAKFGKKNISRLVLLCSLMALLILLWACTTNNHNKHDLKPPIPVVVAKIQKSDVPLYLNTIGTVTPIESVIVKTQVNGRLTAVLFQEGQQVQKGGLLAQIDPLPYEAQLQQAEGQLLKDTAILENARLDLKRYKTLYQEDSISQQTLDTQKALVKQLEGVVQSDHGLVESVKINLAYCKISSDISGVIGLRQVNPGNYIQTTDATPITTINTISPISVVFPLPEDNLIEVHDKFKENPLTADAFDRKGEIVLDTGQLSAIDSQIDNTTGTIKLKAIFKNKHHRLYPNQFVNIRLKIGALSSALVIPTAAILIGRQGPFIYVLNPQSNSVSVKSIAIKTSIGENSAISGDIQEGQVVIIQGQDKLTEDAIVKPTQENNQPAHMPVEHSAS
ncbi:MAG: efflux RND transporter periplasmic adaptor subunit [Candidatus Paracaedibacter sp.]